jgi:hypothetical protein
MNAPATYAGGVFVGISVLRGRSRIEPFGAVEVGESEVLLLDGQGMRVDAEGQGRVRVPKLVGDPADRAARVECKAGEGVPGRVELQGTDAELLGTATHTIPAASHVSLVQRRACLRA